MYSSQGTPVSIVGVAVNSPGPIGRSRKRKVSFSFRSFSIPKLHLELVGLARCNAPSHRTEANAPDAKPDMACAGKADGKPAIS